MRAMQGLVFAGLLAAFAGCGINVAYVPLNASPAPRQARPVESVEVWSSGRPSRPFVDLGIIEAQEEAWSGASPADIVAAMRQKAAAVGCDGLVLTGGNDAVVGSMTVQKGQGSGSVTTLKGYRGTCIVYRPIGGLVGNLVAAPGPDGLAITCEPPCSPGYQCVGGKCQPLCNPPCPAGAVCGSDRVCRRL